MSLNLGGPAQSSALTSPGASSGGDMEMADDLISTISTALNNGPPGGDPNAALEQLPGPSSVSGELYSLFVSAKTDRDNFC